VKKVGTVSAIIPTWNRADLLSSILANLNGQTRKLDQIVVVDNGSADGSNAVAESFGVDLVSFPENRGFAVAVNEGIARSYGDWVLIINNDVILKQDWLARLLATAENENASFAAGKLLRPDGSNQIDGSWDLISRAAYAWRCGYGKMDSVVWSTKRKIAFAPMTAALFRRSVFQKIGFLETRFESYYEDVDFGVRCALAGLEGVYEPTAVATHMSKTTLGKTSNRVYFLTARNQVLILAKYYSAATLFRFAWPVLVGQVLALFAAARQRNLWAAIRGKWAGLRLWRTFGNEDAGENGARIKALFADSEREIRRLQQEVGFDPYWRLYFALVRVG